MPLQRGPMSFRLFDVLYRDEPASFDEFLTVLGVGVDAKLDVLTEVLIELQGAKERGRTRRKM